MTSPAHHAKTEDPGIWRTFWETPLATKAVLLGVFVNKLAAFIQIFLVLFMTDRGYTASQAGLALGLYGAGAVLGVLLGGTMADRLGPRNATVISMAGSAVLIAALLYVPNYLTLLVVVVLVSLVGQFYRPASQTLLTELTPKHQLVMITAMWRLGLNLGTTAAPLIGVALLSISYDLLFWAEALAALLYAVIAALTLPHRSRTRAAAEASAAAAAASASSTAPTASTAPAPPTAPSPPTSATDASPATPPSPTSSLSSPTSPTSPGSRARSDGYQAMFADRRYLIFLLAMFINGVVYCQYLVTLPLDLTAQGLSPWVFGALVAINGFVVIALELPATKITQHWPLRRAALCGFGLVVIGYAVYALPPVIAVFVAGTLIWTMAEVLGAPTLFAYPGLVAPDHLRGRYIAANQAAFGLSYAVGPVVGALLWSQAGRSVWLVFGAIQLVAVALGLYGIRNLTPTDPTPEPPDPLPEPVPVPMAEAAADPVPDRR